MANGVAAPPSEGARTGPEAETAKATVRRFSLKQLLSATVAIGLPRRQIGALLGLHLVSTLFESFGIGMLLPIFDLIQKGGDATALAAQSGLWRTIVDVYGALGLEASLPSLLITSFLAILVRQAFVYVRLLYGTWVSLRLGRAIRTRLFNGILRARLDVLEGGRQGHVLNDITNETDRATTCATGLVAFGGHVVLGLVYFAFMMVLSPTMTAAAIGVLALAALPVAYLSRHSAAISHDIVTANRALIDFFAQRISAIRLVRLSGSDSTERREFDRRIGWQMGRVFHSNVIMARTKVLIEPVVVAAAFIFLFIGSSTLGIGLEAVGLFLLILLRLVPVLRELMVLRNSMAVTQHSLYALSARLDALDRAPEREGGSRRFEKLDSGIRFERVSFTYETTATEALADLSLDVPAGRLTALVGPSGSGKSTLIDLLPRLREPSTGTITYDGVPLTEFSLASLREGIAYAPQAPQLFDATIGEHIRYGRADASDTELEAAAKLAGAHDFVVALPARYQTRVGEGGGMLSGGQRQRIDLARALIKESPLLVLDEPTSQLDAESEELFKQSLRRIRDQGTRTIILVAHRLSTAALADRIVVMGRGRIVETGTHAELLAREGWYADAWRLQQSDAPAREPLAEPRIG